MNTHQLIVYGKPILCSKCGKPGGTLVKDGKDGYCHHSNDPKCRLIATYKKVKR